ncbi:hypothetical protein VV404_004576 [Salmonella enterica]|jgi:hypothetical protein|nr:hypothetical protein [Salmonella enterica]EMD7527365.1 hypothetical protein [Salmonella enterica]
MNFETINFSKKCFIDLHVEGYESVSGAFFTEKKSLFILEQLFKESHDWQPSFEHDGISYVKGFIDPGNVQFQQFMRDEAEKEKNHANEFYKLHGYYEQTHDFCEVWDDNDICEVQISFPVKS